MFLFVLLFVNRLLDTPHFTRYHTIPKSICIFLVVFMVKLFQRETLDHLYYEAETFH